MTDVPRIYVADLAAYNAGKLRGVWIDATKEPDEIHAEVLAMLAGSPEPVGHYQLRMARRPSRAAAIF